MIFKPAPPFSGLINLVMVTSCTTYGVLLLVPISTDTKLGGLYLKSRKTIQYYHDLGFGLTTKARHKKVQAKSATHESHLHS
jgi:hypothetical protein